MSWQGSPPTVPNSFELMISKILQPSLPFAISSWSWAAYRFVVREATDLPSWFCLRGWELFSVDFASIVWFASFEFEFLPKVWAGELVPLGSSSSVFFEVVAII